MSIVLPGDQIPADEVPQHPKRKLALGPGIRLECAAEGTLAAKVAGTVSSVQQKKNTIWVDSRNGRYTPTQSDPVIGRITGSANECFMCQLSPYTAPAMLPHLSFENVTKKTKPALPPGSLVYARVSSGPAELAQIETELTCVNPATTRADGLGPLRGGALFPISLGMARRLLATGRRAREIGQVVILDRLGQEWAFEVAVGRNGYIWVSAAEANVQRTMEIGKAVVKCDEDALTIEEQEQLAASILQAF